MVIAHLADLHLGKNVNGYSMIEDQKYILKEILNILKEEKIRVVLISGDVYDRPVPSVEATVLLDAFLSALQKEQYEVFMIAGNHDSGERLAYGSSLLDHMQIHVIGNYAGSVPYHDLQDDYGTVRFHLLPFIRPADVNRYQKENKVHSYNDALQQVLSSVSLSDDRNVILSHQFVTGSAVDPDGSEELSLGGIDQVDGHLYDEFDYVALGHIHRPQKLLRETMRYAGTPLCYSFSEVSQTKSIPIIDMKEKGNTTVHLVPLKPLHKMKEIHGFFQDIMARRPEKPSPDYVHVTLNDEEDITDAVQRLRTVYPNLMKLDYDNTRTKSLEHTDPIARIEKENPLDVFTRFYKMRNGREMSEEQKKFSNDLMTEIWQRKEDL